jgi:hypothetical protein
MAAEASEPRWHRHKEASRGACCHAPSGTEGTSTDSDFPPCSSPKSLGETRLFTHSDDDDVLQYATLLLHLLLHFEFDKN